MTKYLDRGIETDGVTRDPMALGVEVVPVTAVDAERQLELRRLGLPVVTADRLWAELDLPADVILIR